MAQTKTDESSNVEEKRLHFGSLEGVMGERLKAQENGGISSSVIAGIKAGNINISGGINIPPSQCPLLSWC